MKIEELEKELIDKGIEIELTLLQNYEVQGSRKNFDIQSTNENDLKFNNCTLEEQRLKTY